MNLENVMLSEIGQKQTKVWFRLYEVPGIVKFIEAGSRLEVTKVWERGGNGRLLFTGYRVFIWDDEKIIEIDNGDGCSMM